MSVLSAYEATQRGARSDAVSFAVLVTLCSLIRLIVHELFDPCSGNFQARALSLFWQAVLVRVRCRM